MVNGLHILVTLLLLLTLCPMTYYFGRKEGQIAGQVADWERGRRVGYNTGYQEGYLAGERDLLRTMSPYEDVDPPMDQEHDELAHWVFTSH